MVQEDRRLDTHEDDQEGIHGEVQYPGAERMLRSNEPRMQA
jgi:hypothetical protein